MAFKSSDVDTSYREIKPGTTRSGLKRRTNNANLPRRWRSPEKGGGEGREGKKKTKSSPKEGGPDTMLNGNSTDYANMKNGKLPDHTQIRKSHPIPASIKHILVSGSNITTTPRLNTDETLPDTQENIVRTTITARISDTKRKLPVANCDCKNVTFHPVPRSGKKRQRPFQLGKIARSNSG